MIRLDEKYKVGVYAFLTDDLYDLECPPVELDEIPVDGWVEDYLTNCDPGDENA